MMENVLLCYNNDKCKGNKEPALINNDNQIDWMNEVNLIKCYIKPC